MAYGLRQSVAKVSWLRLDIFWKPGSSLIRQDFFDWLRYFRVRARRYEAVIFMNGANDAQGFVRAGGPRVFGSPRWKREFARLTGRTMDTLLAAGVQRVYWVGMPVMSASLRVQAGDGIPSYSRRMSMVNAIFKREAGRRPRVSYVDTWRTFARPDGGFDQRWRAEDGCHFSYSGVRRMDALLLTILRRDWRAR